MCVCVCVRARETLKSFSADVAVNRPVISGRVIYGCGKRRCKSVISFPQFVTSDRTSVGRIIRDTSTQYIKEIGLIMSPIAYAVACDLRFISSRETKSKAGDAGTHHSK